MKDGEQSVNKERAGWRHWLKGLGLGAFLFFLIKGLVWLAVFFGAASFLAC